MTFAALRKHVLEANALSTDRFAEEVSYKPRGGSATTITVKIEAETKPRRDGGNARPVGREQVDAAERIRVMVSRDATFAGGAVVDTLAIGSTLVRASARDADVRPWTFAGEVIAHEALHAVYVFERSRRTYDARR